MDDDALLPITDPSEIKGLLAELPVVVDEEQFVNLVSGFPRRYLSNTPRLELIKHFFLLQSLRDQTVISSLSREGDSPRHWKLVLVTRDRESVFASISGTLSCFGMSIRTAEAFGNRAGLALDTFGFRDPDRLFEDSSQRDRFQKLLEAVLEGSEGFEVDFRSRWNRSLAVKRPDIRVSISNDSHPTASHLRFEGPDHFGLLFGLSRFLADRGHVIEVASIQTTKNQVCDDFYISQNGEKLDAREVSAISTDLQTLMEELVSHRQSIDVILGGGLNPLTVDG